jgi:hypothetical protein
LPRLRVTGRREALVEQAAYEANNDELLRLAHILAGRETVVSSREKQVQQ